jgi:hypothetical protein
MVYFFYEQSPKYNRDKYHKRIKSVPLSVSAHQGALPEQETKWRVKDIGLNASFEPKQPASVLEEVPTRKSMKSRDGMVGGSHMTGVYSKDDFKTYLSTTKANGLTTSFDPPHPASVLEEQDERVDPITKKTGHGWEVAYMDKPRIRHFDPALPPSVLEEDNSLDCYDYDCDDGAPMTLFESTKCFFGKRNHATEKPQDILEFFVKYWTDEGDVVLDPTMGSGSTGVACKRLKRHFIGIEMDAKYYEVCEKRMK